MIWKINHRTTLDLTHHAHIIGILNATPDSFSDGGEHHTPHTALTHAREMITHGATIIDIGGESTRPGATPISPTEELRRTIPIITALRAQWDGLISIDTTKATVAAAALTAGANIVNDISGLTADPAMPALCAHTACAIIVMHIQGTPQTMQVSPTYTDITSELRAYFLERLTTLTTLGIHPHSICFDPGIGFGKTTAHNLELLRNIHTLAPPGSPLLLGASRKSFLAKTTPAVEPTHRDAPTIALTALTRARGIMLHRVHSVRENLAALRITEALLHP